MAKETFYHQELAATAPAAASSDVPEGRGMAAAIHGGTLLLPVLAAALAVQLIARFDRRPFVRQAAQDARWFDLWVLGLALACVVLLEADPANEQVAGPGSVALFVLGVVFVGSHVLGVVQSLRGRRFRYPLPPRIRWRRS